MSPFRLSFPRLQKTNKLFLVWFLFFWGQAVPLSAPPSPSIVLTGYAAFFVVVAIVFGDQCCCLLTF